MRLSCGGWDVTWCLAMLLLCSSFATARGAVVWGAEAVSPLPGWRWLDPDDHGLEVGAIQLVASPGAWVHWLGVSRSRSPSRVSLHWQSLRAGVVSQDDLVASGVLALPSGLLLGGGAAWRRVGVGAVADATELAGALLVGVRVSALMLAVRRELEPPPALAQVQWLAVVDAAPWRIAVKRSSSRYGFDPQWDAGFVVEERTLGIGARWAGSGAHFTFHLRRGAAAMEIAVPVFDDLGGGVGLQLRWSP